MGLSYWAGCWDLKFGGIGEGENRLYLGWQGEKGLLRSDL